MCLRDRALAVKAGKKTCRVPGCDRPACTKPYLARRRICSYHTTLSRLQLEPEGPWVRWCQQCRRFQSIEEFDSNRKSCRNVLATHNSRRYKRDAKEVSLSRSSCHDFSMEAATEGAKLWGDRKLQSAGSFDTSSADAQCVLSANPSCSQQPLLQSGSVPETPKANDAQGFAAAFHAGALAAALQDTALRMQAAAASGTAPNPFAASCFDPPSSSAPGSLFTPPTPSAALAHPAFGPAQQLSNPMGGQGLALGGAYYSRLLVEEKQAPAPVGPFAELMYSPLTWA